MIENILNKNLQYNLLSLLKAFLGFIFIILLGKKFGIGEETDIYFLAIMIITYLGYFIQSLWEAMPQYYIAARIKNKEQASKIYSILLNDLLIVSIFIIILYFIISENFNILSAQNKNFLDIYIFLLIFQNILFINKGVLNSEHFYASFYIVDIFIYLLLLLALLLNENISLVFIAYTALFATILSNIGQFYLIFYKIKLSYRFQFYDETLDEIYKNSIKLKIGSLFYGIKDIIIPLVFTSFGVGTYSLYSYANKFASVVVQIINTPIMGVFSTKINYIVANREYNKIKENITQVLYQTVVLFSLSILIVYFILPYVLNTFFEGKFTSIDISNIIDIFLFMSIFYFIWVFQSPYGRLITVFKLFDYGIYTNILFAFCISILYFLFKMFHFDYIYFLLGLSVSQFIQFLFIYNTTNHKIESFKK